MDKASLVFVRNRQSPTSNAKPPETAAAVDWGLGVAPGTRLRARLESAVSTAVRTPVVAVIEYNYEQNGEIVVPAGAKAFGHLETADRSGYVGIRFDSLLMPDGSSVGLEAAATDLQLQPLRGKVEGKHTGKNILVRSFAGVGEIAATLVARGSLNQPLSEGDLLRERVSNNIGQDQGRSDACPSRGMNLSGIDPNGNLLLFTGPAN
jgi:type IV secretory pathway VirB10-like protein